MEAPTVSPYDWIYVGQLRAVVCTVRSKDRVEIVWLDDRNRAINEDAVWNGQAWQFASSGPSGGYADKNDRLAGFVSELRHGRPTRPSC
jgi:hypothetical protein